MISDVLSIKAMSNIFKECDKKLSYGAMQLYQNLLQHHFSSQEEHVGNLNEFVIKYQDIPSYEKYRKLLTELDVAKLIELSNDGMKFLDVWTKHIQLSRFREFSVMKTASEFQDEMQTSQQLIETVGMKARLKREEVNSLLATFIKEQDAIGKKYQNQADCRKHFMYWVLRNADKTEKSKVTSSAKILGQK